MTLLYLSPFTHLCLDVDGKVIHLVERAPPQTTQQGSGSGGVPGSSGATQGGNQNPNSTSGSQGTPLGPTHDRNANSYVMLGTFNVPVNIMDPQQIQVELFYTRYHFLFLFISLNVLFFLRCPFSRWWQAWETVQEIHVSVPARGWGPLWTKERPFVVVEIAYKNE